MFTSQLPDVEIPATPLTRFILRHADELSAQPALVDGTSGLTITYGELSTMIQSLAGGLVEAGITRGDLHRR